MNKLTHLLSFFPLSETKNKTQPPKGKPGSQAASMLQTTCSTIFYVTANMNYAQNRGERVCFSYKTV